MKPREGCHEQDRALSEQIVGRLCGARVGGGKTDGQVTRAGKDESTGCTCAARTEHELTVIQWGDVRVVGNFGRREACAERGCEGRYSITRKHGGMVLVRRGETKRGEAKREGFAAEMEGPR